MSRCLESDLKRLLFQFWSVNANLVQNRASYRTISFISNLNTIYPIVARALGLAHKQRYLAYKYQIECAFCGDIVGALQLTLI